MGTDEDRAASALDDLLQRAVRQGYLDPVAGLAARSGVERLRTFIAGAGGDLRAAATPPAGAPPGEVAAEEEAEDAVLADEPPAGSVPGAGEPAPTRLAKTPAAQPGTGATGCGAGADHAPGTRLVVPLRGGRRAELLLPERFDGTDASRVAAVLEAVALDDEPPTGT
ncbi:hypothetical protein [Kineococcus glutinatus]|uniref:Uncharacterized protein n=1 Tax=Kineococcus glutinatus TaxID=1070872 RepID=A0ABP9I5M4_9ACTN